jgi:hypothetical protein
MVSLAIIEKPGFKRRSTGVANMLFYNVYFMGSSNKMSDDEAIFYLALKIQKYYI